MRIQLWSYNFDPEPAGIGIVAGTLARGLRASGHEVEVVAAHPHYPEPRWGSRIAPYREERSGIRVTRLPLWIGRATARERYRQELTFTAALSAATPFLDRPDVLISASPSFPALLPAIATTRLRHIPWVLWLHDLLPEGALATGIVPKDSTVVTLARQLERVAYRTASRIVVLSRAFRENLMAKEVPSSKIDLVYDPATRIPERLAQPSVDGGLRILSMGNIGYSQGLPELVGAFEARSGAVPGAVPGAMLRMTGTGVAAEEVHRHVRSERVHMLGLVDDRQLEAELQAADIAFVSQRYEGSEFNIPSKLMNFMAYGLPVLAAVNPAGEVARIIRESGGGWVVDSSQPESFPDQLARLYSANGEIRQRAQAARRYAEQHFSAEGFCGALRAGAGARALLARRRALRQVSRAGGARSGRETVRQR